MTFGCSWTFGVGANYMPGMTKEEYHDIAWNEDAEKNSFRTLLSRKYNLNNVNFSQGGSSNQRQFRQIEDEFLFQQNFKNCYNQVKDESWPDFIEFDKLPTEIQDECINQHNLRPPVKPDYVLWAITSTARNEVWSLEDNNYHNFFYHHPDKFSKFWLKNIYSHTEELNNLTRKMILWNDYFKYHGIKNLWVDTFNIHSYPADIDNLIRPYDLLSGMISQVQEVEPLAPETYHTSDWKNDNQFINTALELGLVNPISLHPTVEGHQRIADFLSPYLEDLL